ncbi:putative membrane protein [Candidatus Protofrankia californiensis]|uniref:Putative membrane protein n=1 Tax=Candidatus Protofrankia californiensis TaxID=1839754 RepID=A0A1C3NUE1_9ACTN|nr:putative membrane protein [Candidatus Protofrankia californiensis]
MQVTGRWIYLYRAGSPTFTGGMTPLALIESLFLLYLGSVFSM